MKTVTMHVSEYILYAHSAATAVVECWHELMYKYQLSKNPREMRMVLKSKTRALVVYDRVMDNHMKAIDAQTV